MRSKFFSLSSALAMSGHPVAAQGRDGGPYSVRSVAIIYDRVRSLFQAVFFEDGLDKDQLARDVERAGYSLHTILPVPPLSQPATTAAEPARPAARKARKAVDARARAEEAVELLRQLMVL